MSSSPDKTEERSMSDILASIRKIMAQDSFPPGAPQPPASGARDDSRTMPTLDMPRESAGSPAPAPRMEPKVDSRPPTAGAGTATKAGPDNPPPADQPVSLDEFLALTAPLKTAGPAVAVPVKPPRTDEVVTIPLLRTDAAPTPAEAAKTSGSGPDGPGPHLAGGPASVAGPAKGPGAAAPAAGTAATRADAPKPADTPQSAPRPLSPPVGDLGSVVPGQLDSSTRSATGAPSLEPPRTAPASGPPMAPARGPSLPSAPPAASPRTGPTPIAEIPGADALRRLIADVVPPSARAPLPTPSRPSDDVQTEVVIPRARAPEPEPVAKTPVTEPASPAAPAAPPPKGEVPRPAAKAPEAPVPAAKPDTTNAMPTPGPSPMKADPAPAAKAPDSSAAPATASMASAQAGAPPAATVSTARTMDETVVELLRPLLREWLDKNMPRLIEPALKAEMEALRAKLDEKPKG